MKSLIKAVLTSTVFAVLPSVALSTMTQITTSGTVPAANNGYEITGSYSVIIPGGTTVNTGTPSNNPFGNPFSIAQDDPGTSTVTFTGLGNTNVQGGVGDSSAGGSGPTTIPINEIDFDNSTVSFGGDVNANTIKVIGSDTVTFAGGAVAVTDIDFNAPGTLIMSDLSPLTATAVNFNTGGGTLTINNDATTDIIFAAGTNAAAGQVNLAGLNFTGSITNQSGNPFVGNLFIPGITFNGNIGASDASIGTMQFQGEGVFNSSGIYAQYIVFTGSFLPQLILESDVILNTQAIYSTSPSAFIAFKGNATINGTVGTFPGTLPLNFINVGANGKTITFNNDVATSFIVFQSDGSTFTFNGSLNAVSAITANAATSSAIINLNGNTVFNNLTINDSNHVLSMFIGDGVSYFPTVSIANSTYTAALTQVNPGSTLSILSNQTINGPLVVNGNLALNYGYVTTVLGGLGLNIGNGSTGQLSVNLNNTANLGAGSQLLDLNNTSALTFGNGAIISVSNPPYASTTIPLVRDATSITNANNTVLKSSNSLVSFKLVPDGTTGLDLVLSISPSSGLASPNNQSLAAVLDQLAFLPINGLLLLQENQIGSFTNAAQYNQALQTLAPQVNQGVLQGSFNLMSQTFLAANDRMDYLRLASGNGDMPENSGIGSGDIQENTSPGVWMKLLGQHGHQRKRGGIEGFSDKNWGLAVGIDTIFDDLNTIAGLAFTWSSLDVHTNETKSATHANSYQGTLYGGYNFSNPWFLDGVLTLAINEYRGSRNVTFGNLKYSPQSDYQGWQLGAEIDAGYDYNIDAFHIVPLASLSYVHLGLDSYTEYDADNAAQRVQSSDYGQLLAGAGIEFAYDIFIRCGMFRPEVHAQVFYDFIDDAMQTTSQFTGGGASFFTLGARPARWLYDVGASILNIQMNSGLSLALSYDFNFRQDYNAHSGFARMQYRW